MTESTAPLDEKLFMKWLESQPNPTQQNLAETKLHDLLQNASQPRHASGNACIKLCYFIEQCRNSGSLTLQNLAFSKQTCLDLFNFYLEWNEKNQNRSMRQVLELLSSLVARNPNEATAQILKKTLIQRVLSIIGRRESQVLVKPAFKSLECFLSKKTISPEELIREYDTNLQPSSVETLDLSNASSSGSWDSFISEVFKWLAPADVSPATGKFLVTLFKHLKDPTDDRKSFKTRSSLWQHWIRKGLANNPQILENVKNYLFPALFKTDRPGSLEFLRDLNQSKLISDIQIQDIDSHALLQLASIEVGKKTGLVEELDPIQKSKLASKKSTGCVVLQESIICSLLGNCSDAVRTMALSVLVSSSSSIRPFSPTALNGLRCHMALLFADPDAKFRNEVLSNTKHLIERLRGAVALLTREADQLLFKSSNESLSQSELQGSSQSLLVATQTLLHEHERFIEWYLEFLLGELISTASYQRHITSLKAILLLLQSRVIEDSSKSSSAQVTANSTIWPSAIALFNPRAIRLLLDLLMDPFEDVRSSATEILKQTMPAHFADDRLNQSLLDGSEEARSMATDRIGDEPQIQREEKLNPKGAALSPSSLPLLKGFIQRAKQAALQTGRADYADGVARSYQILYSLQGSLHARVEILGDLVTEMELLVNIAKADLTKAVQEAPIHGHFSALNMVWQLAVPSIPRIQESLDVEYWKQLSYLQDRIVIAGSRIWNAVRDILCNDSPEGHLPEDIEDIDNLDTKDILSYSFRAIHESSNLLRTISLHLKFHWPEALGPELYKVLDNIGNLTFLQLSTLRHRGAFSTVSLTYFSCCQLTQQNLFRSNAKGQNLLQVWWEGSLQSISSQGSTTRRSAGIPALVTGIMAVEAASPSYEDIIKHIKSIASRPVSVTATNAIFLEQLPEVHALNTLKEIFKSSHIRRKADSHVTDCFQIAASCLGSKVWPIRNAGLLLLQSLINYVLGMTESKAMTEEGWDGGAVKISYDKYPNLVNLLLELLDASTSTDGPSKAVMEAVEQIFPALDIIRRAGPPLNVRDSIFSKVSEHLSSKVWHVRELAARTICVLTSEEDCENVVNILLQIAHGSANQQHGALIAIKLIYERQVSLGNAPWIESPPLYFNELLGCHVDMNDAPAVIATKIDIGNIFLELTLSSGLDQDECKTRALSEQISNLNYGQELDRFSTYIKMASPLRPGLAVEAIIRRLVLVSVSQKSIGDLKSTYHYALSLGINAALAAVEVTPPGPTWLCQENLKQLFKLYAELADSASSSQLWTANLSNMFEILVNIQDFSAPIISHGFQLMDNSSKTETSNPEMQNAIIKISGFRVLSIHACSEENTSRAVSYELTKWGSLLKASITDDMDFDTRIAAAIALNSVFNKVDLEHLYGDECLLPAFMSVYTGLQDDDDKIRQISAETVSHLTGNPSASAAATEELIVWLGNKYHGKTMFAWNVIFKLTTGNADFVFDELDIKMTEPSDARAQFSESLQEDTLLFAIEKQNLWVDDVREVKRWASAFQCLPKECVAGLLDPEDKSPMKELVQYTSNGLEALLHQLENEDGVLGWSFRPVAFTMCTRLLICANCVISYAAKSFLQVGATTLDMGNDPLKTEIERVLSLLELVMRKGIEQKLHEQLLQEVIGPNALAMTKLDILMPWILVISEGFRPAQLRRL
ncbi:putative death-receptor fusion protein-domain-containing protein [Tricladium varicosporioides]|nr:putative death-receptor fusion protein-domain-containing protein [Hymenoscyphus varicosporioides]